MVLRVAGVSVLQECVLQSEIGADMLEIHANAQVLDDASKTYANAKESMIFLQIYANAVELPNEHEIYAFAKGLVRADG